MESSKNCEGCGQPLMADAPAGLCAACLMKVGLGSGSGSLATTGLSEEGQRPAFYPPALEELARQLPQFEFLKQIGHGGMGVVYQVRQKSLDRIVALKMLAKHRSTDPKFAERFSLEAHTLARLNHPNIIAVFDFGETSGLCYLVMEYVEGLNLRQVLSMQKLAPREALAIVPELCDALQYAHEQGIVHRDIKPENIMLDHKGRVKIADFGLARLLGLPLAQERLTQPKDRMGTPHYMAPEQIEHPHEVDHRADIFSLGVVFYEMLTGELPLGKFPLPSQKVLIDVRLDEVVLRALEKEPGRRYQQASEVKTAVEALVTAAPPKSFPEVQRASSTNLSARSTDPATEPASAQIVLEIWPTLLFHTVLLLAIVSFFNLMILIRPPINNLNGALLSKIIPGVSSLIQSFFGGDSDFWIVSGVRNRLTLTALLCLSFDASMCYVIQDCWGKRLLRLWSTAVITISLLIGALVTFSFIG